jgi:hypothetical protein
LDFIGFDISQVIRLALGVELVKHELSRMHRDGRVVIFPPDVALEVVDPNPVMARRGRASRVADYGVEAVGDFAGFAEDAVALGGEALSFFVLFGGEPLPEFVEV